MSEEEQPIPKTRRNWIVTLSKIVFFIVAFFLVIFTILANMGGHSDNLKTYVEEFITQNTGYKAKIKTLNGLSFFPTIALDFEGLDMYRGAIGDIPLVHADRFHVALSFWDMMTNDGKIKILSAIGVKAMPGVLLDKPFTFDTIDIADAQPGQAQLEGKGTIGSNPFSFSVQMSASGEGHARKYFFSPENHRPGEIKLGAISINAELRNGDDQSLEVQNLKAALNGQEVFSGDVTLSRRTSHEIHVTGTRVLAEHKSAVKIDAIIDTITRKITGTVQSDNFDRRYFASGSRFDQLVQTLISDLTDASAHKTMLDDFFKAQTITLDAKGVYTGPLIFENNHLKIP